MSMADPRYPAINEFIELHLRDKPGARSKLARAANVAPVQVTRWAEGTSSPTPEKWRDIERFFDQPKGTCPPGTFERLTGFTPGSKPTSIEQRLADLEARVEALERADQVVLGRAANRRRGGPH